MRYTRYSINTPMKNLIFILTLTISFWATSQELPTDFPAVQQQAEAEQKNIVLVFSGSDWCIPCMKLKKNILDTEEFRQAIQDEYLMVHADFPQKKKNKALQSEALQEQNKKLAEQYNPNGYFPFVVVMTPNLEVKAKLFYEEVSPSQFAVMIAESFEDSEH